MGRVLRMNPGDALQLFDGSNHVFAAEILSVSKKHVIVRTQPGVWQDKESPLHLHLGQVMSHGEKMKFTVQKSIELGVNVITPLFSERCGVKLDGERLEKKSRSGKKSPSPPVSSVAETRSPKSGPPCRSKRGAPSTMKR